MSRTKRFYNYPNLILYEWDSELRSFVPLWHPYNQRLWSSKSRCSHEDWTYKVRRRQDDKYIIKIEFKNVGDDKQCLE